MKNYLMPTKVVMGTDCVVESANELKTFGKKALVVTGRRSAKINGAGEDVSKALKMAEIDSVLYDQVMSNPTVECVFEGVKIAKEAEVEFVIAIGGGSPIDAAKAMALAIGSQLTEETLFSGNYTKALPIITIPTTAGTGTEVTQYSIITYIKEETKMGIGHYDLFPKLSFLDPKYMMGLSVTNTIHTGIDALSHAVEGMMAKRASLISNSLATKSIRMIMETIPTMLKALKTDDEKIFSYADREKLLYASTLAGMVIAQTGTTAVHAMGYSLTYFKKVDHGRANGLLLGEFMKFTAKKEPELIKSILDAMNIEDIDTYISLMEALFGDKEKISKEDVDKFSNKAIITGNIDNCVVTPTKEDLEKIYKISLCV